MTKTIRTDPARSAVMRAVKSKDTAPEMVVRRLVHRLGFRFRLHREDLPGKPDLVFPSRRKILLVNGCFWHGHECSRGNRQPKKNADYWRSKIAQNVDRDVRNQTALSEIGWEVLTIWECEISKAKMDILGDKLKDFLD